MLTEININEIYDKNINFLFGAGASNGLFPTLSLGIKDENGNKQTIETLATHFENNNNRQDLKTLLFMYYYNECIKPAILFSLESATDEEQKKVVDNYELLLKTILAILNRKQSSTRRCRIFTTNYDSCFELIADKLLADKKYNFILNDGTRGFIKKYLQAKNYDSFVYQTGIFDQHKTDIPQINLIHLHGSIYWSKNLEGISINYASDNNRDFTDIECPNILNDFTLLIKDNTKKISDLIANPEFFLLDEPTKDNFWTIYNQLPIVNPTKWKFNETVFEEHYYQMLRLLSYELEKTNTVFIIFGFSFKDEHILNLVQRSLSNPTLVIYICCFDNNDYSEMLIKFDGYHNVRLVKVACNIDFTYFNEKVFTLAPNQEIVI